MAMGYEMMRLREGSKSLLSSPHIGIKERLKSSTLREILRSFLDRSTQRSTKREIFTKAMTKETGEEEQERVKNDDDDDVMIIRPNPSKNNIKMIRIRNLSNRR